MTNIKHIFVETKSLNFDRQRSAARALLAAIKKRFKKKGEFVPVDEFCEFTRLKRESVRELLVG